MMYLPRIAYFPRAWTVEECRDYLTHYGGSYTPEMSLEELRVALLNKTEEHINGLVEESSDLVMNPTSKDGGLSPVHDQPKKVQ